MMTLTPDSVTRSPKSPSESEKSKKYDRQLRLWGDHGQYALESSKVCLINATAVGTETMKSLVLPGIGAFTIVDGNKVTAEDAGSNFFLEKDSIGKSRAKIAAQMLIEMNPDVRGDYIEETPENVLDSNADFFSNFSLVIATGIHSETTLFRLSKTLWNANIPLLVCKTIGMIGYMRIQIKERPVIEAHPDNVLEDLRIDAPFDELKSYFNSYGDLSLLSRKELSHTPYLVIIYKCLQKWRDIHKKECNDMPKSYEEKGQLKRLMIDLMESLREKCKDDDDDKELDLENFDEGIKALNKLLNYESFSNSIPKDTQSILNDPEIEHPSSNFWIMVKALKQFIDDNNGCLPIRGTIPDMISDSSKYIQLQKIYSVKAKDDAETVYNNYQTIADNLNFKKLAKENDIRLFCKNSRFLRLIRTSQIESELSGDSLKDHVGSLQTGDGDGNNELIFYLIFRSVDRFYTQYNRFPGQFNDQVESDIGILKGYFRELHNDLGFNSLSKDDCIHEICRSGGCEIHSVASFIGGCAANEVIKVVTGQFVPFDNTFIYNGITATTVTYKL